MESFKARMRRIRQRAGFASQGKAAEAIGCERGTVSMWEAPSSNVKSVSSEWLFDVARAYRVRPEWINDLRSSDDGFPWAPDAEPPKHTVTSGSHLTGLDPAILHEAVTLLMYDLDHGGPRTARSASDLLMQLYREIEKHGGRLPPDDERAFEAAARARRREGERSDGSDEVDRRPRKSRGTR